MKPVKGLVVWAPRYGAIVAVRRVARDGTWADVEVQTVGGMNWRKRQPLRDGEFPFRVEEIRR